MKPLPIVIAVLALASAGAAFLLFSGATATNSAPAAAPPPPAVTVAPVEVRDLAEESEFTGRIEAVDDVELRARVSGHLQSVHFSAGQLVKKGDVLFTIDPRWHQAALAAAEAQVAQTRVHLENAERESKRAGELLKSKAISAEESESRTARLAEARAAWQSAEAARDSAKLDLEYTEVRAPIDGRIGRALVTPGNFVSGIPAANTVLTTIVSVDPVYVYADVDEVSLLSLRRLMAAHALPLDEHGRVKIEVGLSDESGYPHPGSVESLDNRIDEGTGSIVVRGIVPNPDQKLLPGLFARVRVPSSVRKPTPLVSERAIGTDQSQKFVLVLGEGDTVQYRAVKLGPALDGRRIVREGLQGGEEIVVNGLQRVRPGAKVTPHREEKTADAAHSRANDETATSRPNDSSDDKSPH